MPRVLHGEPWTRDLAGDAADGERRAELVLEQIQCGADSEALLRATLNTAAECGYVLPPTARLRSFCRRLQQRLTEKKAAPVVEAGAADTAAHRGSDAREAYPVPPPGR